MHQTLESKEEGKIIKSEICIVGSGAAGISLALELDKAGRSVLLLESGGFDYDSNTQALNKGENVGQNYFPLESSRLRFFGGTTGHWTGQCSVLDDIDFEEREWVPNSGWPIKKSDLDTYYSKAHEICDLQEYNYSPKYWGEKLEKKPLALDEKFVKTKIWQKSAPTRFGTKYRKDIIDSKNIQLLTNANLTHINLTEYGNEVESIDIATLNGKKHQVKANIFIMACGAIQNVRYLLNSNNVIRKGVGNENGLVGKYFMEHPHIDSADMVLLANKNMDLYFDHSLNSKAFGMLTTSEEVQREMKTQNYSARINTKFESSNGINQNQKSTHYLNQWENLDKRKSKIDKLKNIFGDKQVEGIIDKFANNNVEEYKENNKLNTVRYIFNTRSEQSPNPDSTVQLGNSKDALGIPHTKLNWQLTEGDKQSILKSNIIIGSEIGRLGIGRLKIGDWLSEGKNEWPNFLGGGWHHMGITRMSDSEKKGVVDKNCKVHSVNNLYIAGSSVFTTSGVANPTLTIVALALRLANHLDKEVLKN